MSSQNGDARHDLLHSSLAASGASKAEHTFPSYLLNGTSDSTIFDHTISKTVNEHDNVTLNTDQVISDEEVIHIFFSSRFHWFELLFIGYWLLPIGDLVSLYGFYVL